MVLINQVFPCFHCFSKTTPSHLYKLLHLLHFRGRGEWIVNQLSHVPVIHSIIFVTKNPKLGRVFKLSEIRV